MDRTQDQELSYFVAPRVLDEVLVNDQKRHDFLGGLMCPYLLYGWETRKPTVKHVVQGFDISPSRK